MTVQAQILELIGRLKDELGMAVIIITHDLGVVAEMSDDVAVMYGGRIVERGPTARIFAAPEHPYTWGLLRSIPRLDVPRDEELVPIPGQPPSLITLPGGCSFHPRCAVRAARATAGSIRASSRWPTYRATRSPACCPRRSRRALWRELRAGAAPPDAAPPRTLAPDAEAHDEV